MTFAAVDALDEIRTPIRPVLVVGPGFRRRDELHHRLASAAHAYEVHHDAREMVPIVATATVAVAAFGTSAYELAAARVPAVLIPRRAEDRWHAERFEAAGAAIVAEREPRAIAAALGSLIDDAELRRRLALGGERLVDGRGAERVAALVRELLPRTSRRARGVHGREGERAAAS
jgi:spore coat polysaccharide biosynthesis predicted glycosyltransferase SpsG